MIHFTKMHGLGNDFMVIDAVRQEINLSTADIQKLSNRHTGVGFDQLLLVEPATETDIDFQYRIFNADGGEVEQCGNGARCFARFVKEIGLTSKKQLTVRTKNTIMQLTLKDDGQVQVDMGQPKFNPSDIPLAVKEQQADYSLSINGQDIRFFALSMGNPHAVILVNDVEQAAVESLGKHIGQNPIFPEGVNVGFMQIIDKQHIKLRVYERGAGETQACGTGACAAMIAAQRAKLVDNDVTVSLTGGDLNIAWQGAGTNVQMTGPATKIFEGKID